MGCQVLDPVSNLIPKESGPAHAEIRCVDGRVEAEWPSQAWSVYSWAGWRGVVAGVDHCVVTKGFVSALTVDGERDWEVELVLKSFLKAYHAGCAGLLADAPEVYADVAGSWEE